LKGITTLSKAFFLMENPEMIDGKAVFGEVK
jgi:hypothetical protein